MHTAISRHSIRIAAALCLLLAAGSLRAGEGKIRRRPHAVKGEYIVVLHDDTPGDEVPALAKRMARRYGGTLHRTWQYALKGFSVRLSEGQAEALSRHPNVQFIEEDAEVFQSDSHPTNFVPGCVPTMEHPCPPDNRLWHLDVLDQNSAVGTENYSFCETGSGVYVYVVDSGVLGSHSEFNQDTVLDGYDASGDPPYYVANDPCHGPVPFGDPADGPDQPGKIKWENSHGTAVASLVAGQNVGVAPGAKIVPVKVAPCARSAARKFNVHTMNTVYEEGEVVHAYKPGGAFFQERYFEVAEGGNTGSGPYPQNGWPSSPNDPPVVWGEVSLRYIDEAALPVKQTTATITEGLNWILSPGNPYPKSPAVVTMSVYEVVNSETEDAVTGMELAVGNLLKYANGKGITVIASANNQDANACSTSPGRMSRNNPNNPFNADRPYRVITAGGTMLRNNPDPNPATGGVVNLPEPAHVETKPTVLARWRCHAGDSTPCSDNIYAPLETRPNPTNPVDYSKYVHWALGSNGGACVTLFAPAKNIHVAGLDAASPYRNPYDADGLASGTSWSAPIVAGMAARILQNNPHYNIDQVHQALMSRTTPDLDPLERDPPGVTGTPNAVLRMTPVVVQPLDPTTPKDSNGYATIVVTASGATGLTYQLYEVDPAFDLSQFDRGASDKLPVGPPRSLNNFSVAPMGDRSYFVRVRSSCGSADTNITTVTAATTVPAPAGLAATVSAGTVSISWSAVSGATGYDLERKIGNGIWSFVKSVTAMQTTDAPSVPAGVVLYRVRARQGAAVSEPSNHDVAYASAFTDDPLLTAAPYTKCKAIHLIELRRAVNALRELAGVGPVYAGNDLDETYVRTLAVDDAHLTTLRTNMNAARAALDLPPIGFQSTPAGGLPIDDTQLSDLRAGVK